METFIYVVQILSAILLMAAILVQQRGSGLGSAFGGGGDFYRTKRGAEKIIFKATIVLAVIFLASSASHLFVS